MSEYFVKTGILKSLEELGYKDAQTVVFTDGSIYTKTTINAAGKSFVLYPDEDDKLYSHYIEYGNAKIQVKESWFKDVKIELNKAAIIGKRVEVVTEKLEHSLTGYCNSITGDGNIVVQLSKKGEYDISTVIVKKPKEIHILRTEKIIDLIQKH